MLMTHNFFSFNAPDFPSNISYLFNALQHISSWMTANLLTLNTSKTEFLLIGLKQQIAKIQNCTLNTTHSRSPIIRSIRLLAAHATVVSRHLYIIPAEHTSARVCAVFYFYPLPVDLQ